MEELLERVLSFLAILLIVLSCACFLSLTASQPQGWVKTASFASFVVVAHSCLLGFCLTIIRD